MVINKGNMKPNSLNFVLCNRGNKEKAMFFNITHKRVKRNILLE